MVEHQNLIIHERSHVGSINGNVLGELMLDQVSSNIDRTDTVKGKRSWHSSKHSEILKKSCHLHSDSHHCTQVSLATKNYNLLLGFLGNQGGAKKNIISRESGDYRDHLPMLHHSTPKAKGA